MLLRGAESGAPITEGPAVEPQALRGCPSNQPRSCHDGKASRGMRQGLTTFEATLAKVGGLIQAAKFAQAKRLWAPEIDRSIGRLEVRLALLAESGATVALAELPQQDWISDPMVALLSCRQGIPRDSVASDGIAGVVGTMTSEAPVLRLLVPRRGGCAGSLTD
mgnify:FL=1